MVRIIPKILLSFSAAVILTLVGSGSAFATDTWLRVTSPNFELFGNAPPQEIRTVAIELEQFRSAIDKTLGDPDSQPARIRVIVFRDAASFAPFRPKLSGGSPDSLATGYFQTGEDLNYIVITAASNDRSDGTIFHEYAHFLIQQLFGRGEIPPWLNEGLAEYLQTFRILDERSGEIGGPQTGHIRLLKTLPLMPWDKFFAMDNFTLQQSGDHSRTMFYAQAWALIHSLVQRDRRVPLKQIVQSIATSSKSPAGRLADAGITDLDEAIRAVVSQTHETFVSSKLIIEKPPATSDAATLPSSQMNTVLGDLLYRLKDASAETYIKRALAADPANYEANITLGMLRLRERKFDDARKAFENALAGNPRNYLVHYYFAYLLSREYMDEFGTISKLPPETATRMRSSLRRSIELNPRFVETYKLLALVGLITGDDLNEALKALDQAADLHPGDTEHSLLKAQILMRLERVGEARELAEQVLRTSADRYQRNRAAEIISSAKEYAAAVNQRKQSVFTVTALNNSEPIILKRKDLTDEQVRKIDEDRSIANLNILLDRAAPGELVAVGYVDQIGCSNGRISYRIRTDLGTLNLTGRNFADLKVKVLLSGTRSFSFNCGAEFSTELVVARYRPTASTNRTNDGTLVGLTFVPKIFRMMSADEMANNQRIIIEGRSPSDLDQNARSSAAEIAEMERVNRETQMKQIEERLREPQPSETRVLGIAEKVECVDGRISVSIRSGQIPLILQAQILDISSIAVRSFSSESGLTSLDCRSALPPVNAVFTYTPSTLSKSKANELVSIEFVPAAFRLPQH